MLDERYDAQSRTWCGRATCRRCSWSARHSGRRSTSPRCGGAACGWSGGSSASGTTSAQFSGVAAQRVRAGRPQAGPAAGHARRLGRPSRDRRRGAAAVRADRAPGTGRPVGARSVAGGIEIDRLGHRLPRRTCPSSTPACSTARAGVVHDGGVTASPGLYLIGLPFLRRRKSTLIDGAGVGRPRAGRAPRRATWTRSPAGGRAERNVRGTPSRRRRRSPRTSPAATRSASSAALTETVRLRALLPGGPIEAHGQEDVAALLLRAGSPTSTPSQRRRVRGRGGRRPPADPLPAARHPGGAPAGSAPRRRSAASSTAAWP